MPAFSVVGGELQALLVIAFCPLRLAETVVTLAEVVQQVGVLRLEGQRDLEVVAGTYVVSPLEQMNAVLRVLLETLLVLGDAAGAQHGKAAKAGKQPARWQGAKKRRLGWLG